MPKLNSRLKIVLLEKEMTSATLATILDVSPTVVSNWCNNRNTPTVSTLFTIAHLLDCKVDDLYDYTN